MLLWLGINRATANARRIVPTALQECYVQAYGAFDASLPQLQSGPSGSGGAAPVGYDQQKAIEYADPAAAAMQPAAQPVIYTAPKVRGGDTA